MKAEKATEALAWAALGLHVFPCAPGEKRPLVPGGHKSATTDAGQILDWWATWPDANIGCDPDKSGHWVLDVDTKSNNGAKTLDDLSAQNEALPATWRVTTPSGGFHLWFRGRAPTTAGRLGLGLDTRGGGRGYVLLPGSRLPAGEYAAEAPFAPAAAPEWLAGLLTEAEPVRAEPVDVPLHAARALALRAIAAWPPAVAGEGGNNATYRRAAQLRDLGLPEAEAEALLAEHWNPKNVPPWEPAELARLVANAYKYAKQPPGHAAASVFAEDKTAEPAVLVPFEDLRTRAVPPIEELLPLLERGIPTFLCGAGGVHKSRLALQWALQAGHDGIATPVYVSCEDHGDEVSRRVAAICERMNWRASGFLWDRHNMDSALAVMAEGGHTKTPFYSQMVETLAGLPGHKLLVLDSCYDFARFLGRAKIDEGAVNYFVKTVLQGLCNEADATAVVVWHPSSAGQDRNGMDGWSVAWHNAPRARLALKPDKDDHDIIWLEAVKRNHAARGAPQAFEYNAGALVPARRAVETLAESVRAAVADVPAGCPIVPSEIAAAVAQRRRGLKPPAKELARLIELALHRSPTPT